MVISISKHLVALLKTQEACRSLSVFQDVAGWSADSSSSFWTKIDCHTQSCQFPTEMAAAAAQVVAKDIA